MVRRTWSKSRTAYWTIIRAARSRFANRSNRGASILALGWCLYIADRERANTLYAIPGIDALRELNSGKLQPLIDAWHEKIRRIVIVPQTSRSGPGSTTYEKVFNGGRLWLANANSAMDLSSQDGEEGRQG